MYFKFLFIKQLKRINLLLKILFFFILDLEKVTDYAEEKEIVAASTAALDDAIATVRKYQIVDNAKKRIAFFPTY